MPAYVIFDVNIRDMQEFSKFMAGAKPLVEAHGGRYLARGGDFKVYEGDWQPDRIVLFEFPSVAAFEDLYNSKAYREIKAIRDGCSSARLISVEGAD